jgi:hypothetical protein
MTISSFMFSNDVYSDFVATIPNWLSATTMAKLEAADILAYVNRAQEALEIKRRWNQLLRSVDLVIDPTTLIAPCPDSMRVPIMIGSDSRSVGIIDYRYTVGNEEDCEFVTDFDKTTGASVSLHFHFKESSIIYSPVKLIYQKALDKFTGVGVEYLFFPMGVMDAMLKLLVLMDCGEIGNEYKMWDQKLNERLNEYIGFSSRYLYNQEFSFVPGIANEYIRIPSESLV